MSLDSTEQPEEVSLAEDGASNLGAVLTLDYGSITQRFRWFGERVASMTGEAPRRTAQRDRDQVLMGRTASVLTSYRFVNTEKEIQETCLGGKIHVHASIHMLTFNRAIGVKWSQTRWGRSQVREDGVSMPF